jgi:hypothetical protein
MTAILIPFPDRRRRETAAHALAIGARLERKHKRSRKATPWGDRSPNRESLVSMLMTLARIRPSVVYVLERMVAHILDIEQKVGAK